MTIFRGFVFGVVSCCLALFGITAAAVSSSGPGSPHATAATATVQGIVRDASTLAAIPGATLTYNGLTATSFTGGFYAFVSGAFVSGPFTVSKSGYQTYSEIYLPSCGLTTCMKDVSLTPAVCSLSCSITMPSIATTQTPVSFTGSSAPANCSGSPSIVITFGDGNSYTNSGITFSGNHIYVSPGTYTWTLTVTQDSQTCTKTGQIAVSSGVQPPIAAFTWLPQTPSVNQQVQFADNSTGSAASWSWDFGDGASSTDRNAVHLFVSAGIFPVKLTVSNAGGSNSLTQNVAVFPASTLLADFSVLPALPVAGHVAHFTDKSTGGAISWLWEFGTGATSTKQNPDVTFPDAGSYGVTLTVQNASTSAHVRKSILAVTEDQAPPERITFDEVADITSWPTFGTGAVILTHGWNASADGWLTEMATDICAYTLHSNFLFAYPNALTRVCQGRDWDVWIVDWQRQAAGANPFKAYGVASTVGDVVAADIARKGYSRIHFVAHSAGSNLIEQAARDLSALPTIPHNQITIHETFLDAFDPYDANRYGTVALWADNYVDTRDLIPGGAPDGTDLLLTHAFNVDVTPPSPWPLLCGPLCRHSRPYRFYGLSTTSGFLGDAQYAGADPVASTGGMGFPLSMENDRSLSDLKAKYPTGTRCHIQDGACSAMGPASGSYSSAPARLSGVSAVVTGSGGYTSGTGGVLFASLSLGSTSNTTAIASRVIATSDPTVAPSVLTVDFTTASPATHLAYGWKWTAGGEGDLRIFVDGVLVREMDQRYIAPGSSTEDVSIDIEPAGAHRIIFRLDGFGSPPSSVELTNVQLKYDFSSTSRHRSVAH